MESPYGGIAEVAVKAAEPAHVAIVAGEMATLKPADGATPEPAHMATAKPAAGDEITSNPASHRTEPPVTSASSTPRRRDVRRRSG